MRWLILFMIGLLFLIATFVELGILLFRSYPLSENKTFHVPDEQLLPPAPTATPPASGSLTPGTSAQHIVDVGEWPLQIARCYGASIQDILQANPQIVDPRRALEPGMRITIPRIGSVGEVHGPPCVLFYTVVSGDTWQSIAMKNNADVAVLMSVNNGPITVGTVIKVPVNSKLISRGPCLESSPINIPNGDSIVTQTGTLQPGQALCFKPAAIGERKFRVSVSSPENGVEMAIFDDNETVIKPRYENVPSWTVPGEQLLGSSIALFGNAAVQVIHFTLQLTEEKGPSATPSPETTLMVEAEWPPKLEVAQQGYIRVSLLRANAGAYIPVVETAGNTSNASTPLSFGTPGVDPWDAYGPLYEAVAIAKALSGEKFDVVPITMEEQTLDQFPIKWIWRVTPKEGAESDRNDLPAIDISITIRWNLKSDPDVQKQHPIWENHLAIQVTKPVISVKDLKLSALLNTFIGSGLSIPFIYDRIKERKKKAPSKRKKTRKED